MDKEEIKKYYNTCYSRTVNYASEKFEENGRKNDWYSSELIYQHYNYWNKELNNNTDFSEETKKRLKTENRQLLFLFNDIFKLFHRVCLFEEMPIGEVKNPNRIIITEYDVIHRFSVINHQSLFIKSLRRNKQYKEAIEVRRYLSDVFEDFILLNESTFKIFLLKSPLAEYFTNYTSSLKEAINTDEIKLSIELEEPKEKQLIKEEPKQEKEYNFENNFDNIEPKLIYDYFNRMLVEKKYISKETLQLFLKSAFQEKEKPKQRFKIDNKPTNKKIQYIFYQYYKDIAGKPHGQKTKYVELLGEYFIGFKTDTLMSNFSKTY
ncbi:hypothetical protein [Tenacibaculum finnmarkense]|uniref:hypothetical protein n=1 Tax=Tenacibaculum finnmarkense TaxID=2781243 RepID=UPI001EFAF164|nr:hypothetical protein [Tenacibaculum finnmarkense]MCG8206168.1 hypothetical protein [Tenacibaculum finnmarkense genomovar finnmarkense]MCG8722326.1 hypothetical protein [Tenacibaculum finnmarkense]MCG8740543.1 hypothetical protein [Tenacibaculum finnmarkense]MCG8763995.1 hypothetical protein [Tenacibaculum finnmarkense]MCG8776797.1 hypothetical protein [Tenacibaculum finnmarkense]